MAAAQLLVGLGGIFIYVLYRSLLCGTYLPLRRLCALAYNLAHSCARLLTILHFFQHFPIFEPHTRCRAGFQSEPSLPDVDNRPEYVFNHKHSYHSIYDI